MHDFPSHELLNQLSALCLDLHQSMGNFRKIFIQKLTRSRDCRGYFGQALKSHSKIYVHYLELQERELRSSRLANPDQGAFDSSQVKVPYVQRLTKRDKRSLSRWVRRQLMTRDKFRKRIQSLTCWSQFNPNNPYSDENQLFNRQDYIKNLVLHLPEIYVESLRLKGYLNTCMHDRSQLATLYVEILSWEHVWG